ncbi:copper resistance CopC family protein [Brevibacterium litoralis]|uniref:copper resistance CopC family protein n=1 Tax=Brevibacterium litoralis TaxID=3138935 RepID=UPI0032EDC281
MHTAIARPTRPVHLRLSALIGAVLLALAATFVLAPAVQAHDQLVSSNPADGDELDTQPGWMEFTFSGNVQELGAEVVVEHDEDGQDYSAGEIKVDGATLTSALPEGMPAGDYTVTWRVTSADGHPISGEFGFTLNDAVDAGSATMEASEQTADAESEAPAFGEETADVSGGAVDEPAAADGSTEAQEGSGGMSTPMIVLLSIAGLAVVIAILALLWRRTKGVDTGE